MRLGYTYDPCESGHAYSDGICAGCGGVDPSLAPALSVSSINAESGDTVRVTVSLSSAPALRSLMLSDITYDKGLTLVSVDWLVSGAAITDVDADAGFALLAMAESTDLCGELLALTFSVPSDAGDGEYSVSVSGAAKAKREGFNEVSLDIAPGSGSITVSNTLRGDINDDGAVDSDDAILLLGYTFDSSGLNQSGDMNGDGMFDSDDAIYLLMHTFDPDIYPLAG